MYCTLANWWMLMLISEANLLTLKFFLCSLFLCLPRLHREDCSGSGPIWNSKESTPGYDYWMGSDDPCQSERPGWGLVPPRHGEGGSGWHGEAGIKPNLDSVHDLSDLFYRALSQVFIKDMLIYLWIIKLLSCDDRLHWSINGCISFMCQIGFVFWTATL